MATTPEVELIFEPGCADCARREAALPAPLPPLGDDFDWLVRDYDGFRLFMLEQLAARFSERQRWAPADLEVVMVEALAVALDQLSDMLDRVFAEAFLATARQPASVRRLLGMIGYDAVQEAGFTGLDDPAVRREKSAELEALWRREPRLMEQARRAGPRAIHRQERMVTVADYAERLRDHPLVERASATSTWTGSWSTLTVAALLQHNILLDDVLSAAAVGGAAAFVRLQADVEAFHRSKGLVLPSWALAPTPRTLLWPYLERYRMVGQPVELVDAVLAGIQLSISIRVAPNYFQSEVRRAVLEALGTGVGGFFEPGRLDFGQDLYASDIIQTLAALPGVETVCLNRFQRVGAHQRDQLDAGRIELRGLEVAVLENRPARPARGYLRLTLQGGQRG